MTDSYARERLSDQATLNQSGDSCCPAAQHDYQKLTFVRLKPAACTLEVPRATLRSLTLILCPARCLHAGATALIELRMQTYARDVMSSINSVTDKYRSPGAEPSSHTIGSAQTLRASHPALANAFPD